MPVIADKQARRVEIPMQLVLDLLTRRGLKNVILRSARCDIRTMRLILNVETDAADGDAPSYDFFVDWEEIFGKADNGVPADGTGSSAS
jgi:hypothetical protein